MHCSYCRPVHKASHDIIQNLNSKCILDYSYSTTNGTNIKDETVVAVASTASTFTFPSPAMPAATASASIVAIHEFKLFPCVLEKIFYYLSLAASIYHAYIYGYYDGCFPQHPCEIVLSYDADVDADDGDDEDHLVLALILQIIST